MDSARKILTLAALLLVLVSPVSAATISLAPIGTDPEQAIVVVEGSLLPNDSTEFRSRVGSLTKAIVTFNSDGGSLLAGIEIGKTIRLKAFVTVVLGGQRCASACAFAWLGGSRRFMGNDSFVGFHAAYIEREGRATETGVGNALLGSYLTQIGLSERAVVYITRAAPTEMTWLNFGDAKQIGIDVLPWESVQPSKPPKSPRPSYDATGEDLAKRARSFVTSIQSRWSDANSAGLGWLDSVYANEVEYYGKPFLGMRCLLKSVAFLSAGQSALYRIQANSMMSQCGTSDCVVNGIIEWEARSRARNAASNGMATFAYALLVSGGRFLISAENGKVIQLRTSPLSPFER